MDLDFNVALNLVVPLGIGLLIGIERGWSQRKQDEGKRVAGLRTFSLTGLLGGVSALIAQSQTMWFLPAAILGLAFLVSVSHYLEAKDGRDFGVTSKVALFLTFALAAWSVFDQKIAALSAAVVVTAILGFKPTLHKWLHFLKPEEVYAGIKLLIISVVLLPLLPDQGYGPYEALNPYWIWWMVVLISGLSFMGYMAMKSFGSKAGAFITGIIGSMASSTAVTISLARLARKHTENKVFITSALLAAVVMFVRVIIEVSIVNNKLLSALWLPVAAMVGVLLLGAFWTYYRSSSQASENNIQLDSPLQLKTALKFGLLLAGILLLSEFLSDRFGDGGVIVLSIVAGLGDVDAITLSLSEMGKGEIDDSLASLGIILASVSNTLVKGGIFTFYVGFKSSFRLIVILLIAGAVGVALALTNTAIIADWLPF
ncbi:MAG TPA: MgtC/SapB family protein [Cryomorphaceae bacterium]|nr:MgtC/SapB family protein [Cryomorphaceae bacterium]